jgi:hypothetical protein
MRHATSFVVRDLSVDYTMYKKTFYNLCCAYATSVAWFVLRRRFVIFICAFVEYILINYEKNYVSSPAISAQDGLQIRIQKVKL